MLRRASDDDVDLKYVAVSGRKPFPAFPNTGRVPKGIDLLDLQAPENDTPKHN